MKSLALTAIFIAYASSGGLAGEVRDSAEASAIRAGHNIAVTMCSACHGLPSAQPLSTILGPEIPSFEDIANRPDVTVESLRTGMKSAR